jgi:hypothetical protein
MEQAVLRPLEIRGLEALAGPMAPLAAQAELVVLVVAAAVVSILQEPSLVAMAVLVLLASFITQEIHQRQVAVLVVLLGAAMPLWLEAAVAQVDIWVLVGTQTLRLQQHYLDSPVLLMGLEVAQVALLPKWVLLEAELVYWVWLCPDMAELEMYLRIIPKVVGWADQMVAMLWLQLPNWLVLQVPMEAAEQALTAARQV